MSPLIAILLGGLITGDEDIGNEFLVLIYPIVTNFFAYAPPFMLTVMYYITGSDWILVYWLDNMLIFLIEHWVSNYNIFIIMFASITVLRAISTKSSRGYWIMAVLYLLQATLWEWVVLTRSVASIRYLDPSWNWVNLGGILCPSIFYGVGICKYDFTYEEQAAGRVNDPTDKKVLETEELVTAEEESDDQTHEIPVGDKVSIF